MSVDDLARTAAAQLRDTSARTFDVEASLASIGPASQRRTRAQQAATLVTVTVLILVGWLAMRTAPGAAPGPIGTPTPSPTGPATLLYPLCKSPSDQAPDSWAAHLPTCTSSERAGLYTSALRDSDRALRFTLALPASWTAVGGWPAYPTGVSFFPKGSTSFAAAGDVWSGTGLSLINRDGTAGIVLVAEPSVVSCAAGASGWCYTKPPRDLVGFLRDRSGTGTVRESVVGGLPASIVELAPGAAVGGEGAAVNCSIPYPCSALVGYNDPLQGSGGTAGPTMGRLEQWPTRVIVVPVPRAAGTERVVIWLWSVVDRPTNADQRDLDGLEEIAGSIRFDAKSNCRSYGNSVTCSG